MNEVENKIIPLTDEVLLRVFKKSLEETRLGDIRDAIKSMVTTLSNQYNIIVLSNKTSSDIQEVLFGEHQECLLDFMMQIVANLRKEGVEHSGVVDHILKVYSVFTESDLLNDEYKSIAGLEYSRVENLDSIMYYIILIKLNSIKLINLIKQKED